jgi:hypothetical protein
MGGDVQFRVLPAPGIAAAEARPSVILASLVADVLLVRSMYSRAELSTVMP